MIPRFSVRKPMTVIVVVVLIIVLGVVSFRNMNTDLLPEISLPYVIVLTTYPGASPEAVEKEITRPLEQAMGTLPGIESVSSTSNENYSLISLQFEQTANLETISGDIREKINQINGSWPDMVGTSTILKINPNMIPVVVAGMYHDELDVKELSGLVREELSLAMEGTDGTASVLISGLVETHIRVELEEKEFDRVNAEIRDAIDEQFRETEEELQEGIDKVDEGLDGANAAQESLPAAKTRLKQAQIELEQKIAAAQNELDSKEQELLEGMIQVNAAQIAVVTELETLSQTIGQVESIAQTQQELQNTLQAATEYIGLYEQYTQLDAAYQAYLLQTMQEQGLQSPEEAEAYLEEQQDEAFLMLRANRTQCQMQLEVLGGYDEQLYLQQQAAAAAALEGLAQIDAIIQTIAAAGTSPQEILEQLRGTESQLQEQLKKLEETQEQLESGSVSLEQAYTQIRISEASATVEITDGLIQTIAAQTMLPQTIAQLEATKKQLEDAKEQLEDAREAAYKQADLHEILTLERVAMILAAENFSMPAGYVENDEGQTYIVRVGDELTQEQLEKLLLLDLDMEGLEPVCLSDIATIRTVDNTDELYAKLNLQNGIMVSFSKQSNYSTSAAARNITKKLNELEKAYPGLHFVQLLNQGDYIKIVTDSVLNNLVIGAVLAVIILFLFLQDIRPTLITAFSIPISVMFAITLMYFSGVSINVISLAGLAVAVGMLVDNSIVVIENIFRMRQAGMSSAEAAVKGAVQVAGAITASTLTTVCVFLPIVFVHGLTRQIFQDMALTIGYSLLASLAIALSLVPTLSLWMLRKRRTRRLKVKTERDLYTEALSFCLKHKAVTLLTAVAMLAVSVLAGLSRGFSYMPEMASTEIMVSVDMTDENATLEDTKAFCDGLTEKILEYRGVDYVGVTLSAGVASVIGLDADPDPTRATMYVLVDENARVYGLEDEIRQMTEDAPCEIEITGSSSIMGFGSALGGSGVTINVYANDLDVLRDSAQKVADMLRSVEGIDLVDDGIGETTPELRVTVDKTEAMKYGLTVAQVYQELSAALQDETVATTIESLDESIEILVYAKERAATKPEDVREYTFRVTDYSGEEKEVRLADIAQITETETLTQIQHTQQRRYLSVTGTLKQGYNVTKVNEAARNRSKGLSLQDGVRLEFAGESRTIYDAMKDMVKMLLLGILIIYLIMVAQFQSLRSPFVVMFTIPLAFTGGFLALWVTGKELSIVAMVGFIMLVGIIVNNGIVLVDYANQLRESGKDAMNAITEAGRTRLRPVLMTVLTTVLGLVPLAAGMGSGADLIQPVAIVCIGGLLYATLMTLFVVPVMYVMTNRKKEKKGDGSDE
ncbi:MAG: efflux RND transporter permease subunit [Clostridia bacterium]|nr:efflux RND transporter permease subunit [Clostridia bacterium]